MTKDTHLEGALINGTKEAEEWEAAQDKKNSKPIYSVEETIKQVNKRNQKIKDKEKQDTKGSGSSSSSTSSSSGGVTASLDEVSTDPDPDSVWKSPSKWTKEHTTYENGWYWVTDKNGKKTKLTRWSLDNAYGVNLEYASDSKYRDAVTSTFGTYDKKYNPYGVKETNDKLIGETSKLGNSSVVKVKVNSKYQVVILDSTKKYSEKDITAALNTSSKNVQTILISDKDVKANINTNMDLNKLTKKQISDLIMGKVTPTLSIKDDGKTIVVTDKNGKKQTIKFNTPVSELGNIAGVGSLTDLYTKGFTAKQLLALRNAATKTYTDAAYNKEFQSLKQGLTGQLETNKNLKGNRVNATISMTDINEKKLYPLTTKINSDDSFGIWDKPTTTNSASSVIPKGDTSGGSPTSSNSSSSGIRNDIDSFDYTNDDIPDFSDGANFGVGSGSEDDIPDFDDGSNDAISARSSDKPTIATYDGSGILVLTAPQSATTTVNTKKTTTVTRQTSNAPIPESLWDKKDDSWDKTHVAVSSIYTLGAGGVRENLMHSLGIWDTTPLQYLTLSATQYNRFKLPTPDSVLQKCFAHVFFVKPHCNIKLSANQKSMDEASHDNAVFANNPNYMYAASSSPEIIKELSYDDGNQTSDFSFILSNAAISFSLNDEYINTDTYGTGYTGYKVAYGKHGVESRTAGDFTVTFRDDRNLSIYRMIKLWDDYIDGCYTGTYAPKASTIDDHVLDYAGAAYYILTAEDGETILFWSKYYGVFPSTIPSNQYSWSAGTLISQITLDVKFNYSWKEDYNIQAISEFNYNSHLENVANANTIEMIPTYNANLGTAGRTWVGAPFIETVYENGDNYGTGNMVFKLRFRSA